MTNEEIIKALGNRINAYSIDLKAIETRLFDNFSFRFQWDAEKLLYYKKYIQDLTAIKNAEGSATNKKEHLEYFIKDASKRLIEYDRTNQSTSVLANFQENVYRNVNKDLIDYFNHLLNG